ncbi:oligosaccharide flippase family protein, partial [Enterococcus cecorum]|uniref:oligosaccharide flippase family protein n=1 Tax=Enterococcus cecorum TaxID=44008 RepID=UPI001FAB8E93
IIMYFIAPLIANFYKLPELTLIIRVFSLRIPLSAFSAIQHAYVERYMLFKRYFYSTLTGTLFSGIIGIIFAYKGYGVWALIAQYFTNSILDIVVLLFTIEWRPKFVFSKKSALKMIDYGSKILLADLSGTFFNELRSLIIGKIYTSSDLAFYNKGNQLPNLITINVTSSIMTVLFPAISNINDDSNRVVELTKKSTKIIAYII